MGWFTWKKAALVGAIIVTTLSLILTLVAYTYNETPLAIKDYYLVFIAIFIGGLILGALLGTGLFFLVKTSIWQIILGILIAIGIYAGAFIILVLVITAIMMLLFPGAIYGGYSGPDWLKWPVWIILILVPFCVNLAVFIFVTKDKYKKIGMIIGYALILIYLITAN